MGRFFFQSERVRSCLGEDFELWPESIKRIWLLISLFHILVSKTTIFSVNSENLRFTTSDSSNASHAGIIN